MTQPRPARTGGTAVGTAAETGPPGPEPAGPARTDAFEEDAAPTFGSRLGWATRLAGADAALLFPCAAGVAWLAGYEGAAMALALVLPAILLLGGSDSGRGARVGRLLHLDRPLGRGEAQKLADAILLDCARSGWSTAALMVQVAGPGLRGGDWGQRTSERAMQALARRARIAMREQDAVFRMGDDTVAVILHPTRRADLDVAMMIADRLQAAMAEPVSVEGRAIRVSCRVGICTQIMAPERTGTALLSAADCALRIAARHEEGAVRAFTPEMQAEAETGHALTLQVTRAIDTGEIRPWFQAQIEARTGALSGFEALARWYHPELGVLAPGQFLDAVEAAGRGAALGERMLRAALEALEAWDRAGIEVPHVGINFSMDEMRDPRLAERVVWEVDRHDVASRRISVEILETVTLDGAEEVIIRNVRRLRDAGFRLDLDDFGTGAAAISHIARFGVHRIKIDRSFIAGIEREGEGRRVVAAILSLAGELGIETLAEGVETPAQAAALAEMGCGHLQGYGVAKPMPFDDTVAWVRARERGAPAPGGLGLASLQPRGTA